MAGTPSGGLDRARGNRVGDGLCRRSHGQRSADSLRTFLHIKRAGVQRDGQTIPWAASGVSTWSGCLPSGGSRASQPCLGATRSPVDRAATANGRPEPSFYQHGRHAVAQRRRGAMHVCRVSGALIARTPLNRAYGRNLWPRPSCGRCSGCGRAVAEAPSPRPVSDGSPLRESTRRPSSG